MVEKDRAVKAGTPLGTVGNTGNAAGKAPLLHFSIFPAGDYEAGIDPFPFLKTVDIADRCTQ